MFETNNPKIDVNELMEKVKLEVAKRNDWHLAHKVKVEQQSNFEGAALQLLSIQSLLDNAETRSQIRTKWPEPLNRFPLNFSKKLQKAVLKVLNFLFKEQRVVNFSLIQALRESLAINRELIQQVSNLQVEIINVKQQLEKVNNRVLASGDRLELLEENYEIHADLSSNLLQQKSQIARFVEADNQDSYLTFTQDKPQKIFKQNNQNNQIIDAMYVAFEDRFRGSNADIGARLKIYLPTIESAKIGSENTPILDLGCGRGEWLELLRDSGYVARGIDLNSIMIEQSASKGLQVIEADVLSYLQSLPDACLGAVTGFHIIEHLPLAMLIELLSQTARVIKPGGVAIFETPNPQNLVVGACNFYADPTHKSPIFPETIQFFLQYQGMSDVQLLYLNPVDDSPFKQIDDKWDILNNWFFGPRDYAVIGHKV